MKELIERLLYEEESTTLDFKEEQYALVNGTKYQKCEFVKDILAFTNAWRREDSYILIGVREVKGGKSIVLGLSEEEQLDDATLQQMVNQKINKPIHFEYKNISIDEKIIGVIKIPIENNIRPFYLKKDCEHVKMNDVQIRRGSSTDVATPDETIKMSQDTLKINNNPKLILEFADNTNKLTRGKSLEIQSEYWNIVDRDDIPDYVEYRNFSKFDIAMRGSVNSGYYREVIKYYVENKLYESLSFSVYNDSNILVTDIKIEIVFDGYMINIMKKLPKKPESSYGYMNHIHKLNKIEIYPDIIIEQRNGIWYLELLFKKVQPKQRIYSVDNVYFAIKGKAVLDYKIYADNLSEPITGNLHIEHNVKKKDMTYKEVLKYHDEIQEKELEKTMKKYYENSENE